MKIPSEIYALKPDYDPRFDGFLLADNAKSLFGKENPINDFEEGDITTIYWRPRQLKEIWKPLPVKGAVNAFNDYPRLEMILPVFSRRAVDALNQMLTNNGELLPLENDVGEYYVFNCLTKIDALDLTKSRIDRLKPTDRASMALDYLVFQEKKIAGTSVFRVPEHVMYYFVTDSFKARVEEAGLNGMDFAKVWPLPEGSNWYRDYSNRCKQKEKEKSKLAGQALVLCFRLKNETCSEREKELATEIDKSLEQKLRVSSLEDTYRGYIEAIETVEGEFRVFCTCPDCDALHDFLADWIQELPWENEIVLLKQYGNLYDRRTKKKRVVVRKAKG